MTLDQDLLCAFCSLAFSGFAFATAFTAFSNFMGYKLSFIVSFWGFHAPMIARSVAFPNCMTYELSFVVSFWGCYVPIIIRSVAFPMRCCFFKVHLILSGT